MIRTIQLMVACVAVLIATAGQMQAAIITFDEASGVFSPGYGGLNWSGFGRIHTPTYFTQDTGYVRGNISPAYTAFTANPSFFPAIVSVTSGTFDFNGAYITAAWQNDLTVTLTGFLNSTVVGSQTFVIDDDFPTFTASNFLGINRLEIFTISGTDAGRGGEFVAIDDFTINEFVAAVPEPSSLAVFGIGACAAGLGAARRRRREKQ